VNNVHFVLSILWKIALLVFLTFFFVVLFEHGPGNLRSGFAAEWRAFRGTETKHIVTEPADTEPADSKPATNKPAADSASQETSPAPSPVNAN